MANDLQQEIETRYSGVSEIQTISTTDVISEGPIYGLVDGIASIHLNDIPQTQANYGQKHYSRTGSTVKMTRGSKTVEVKIFQGALEMLGENESSRYFSFRPKRGTRCTATSISPQTGSLSARNIESAKWVLRSVPAGVHYWWPDDDVLSIRAVQPNKWGRGGSPAVYHPVRLLDLDTNRMVTGKVFRREGNGNSRSTLYLNFVPGVFNGSSWSGLAGQHALFKDAINFELFADRILEVVDISAPTTDSSDASINYTLTLKDPWTYDQSYSFVGATLGDVSNSIIDLGSVQADVFATGDRIRYHAASTGAIGGLVDEQEYFIIKEGTQTVKLASTRENAIDGSFITLTPSSTSLGSDNIHELELNEFDFDDIGYDYSAAEVTDGLSESGNTSAIPGVQAQFRVGTLEQPPLIGEGGVGSSAVTKGLGLEIEQTNELNFKGDQAPIQLQGVSSSGFGLSSTQARMADEFRVRWNYPGGFKALNSEGKDRLTFIRYTISLAFKFEENSDFQEDIYVAEIIHRGLYNNGVSFEETIDLSPFKPFVDFRLTIHRRDSSEKGFYALGKSSSEWTGVTRGNIANVTTIFKEKMVYPLTALSKVSFSSKYFQSTPRRSYHCRGMLVKVPSNYLTREETGGAAKYTKKGDYDSNKAQDWDGTFREGVYTNNPAWIFYDIVTNNRYGLGDFIGENDIDKYALYRIAKYCDEEVDDGKGGTEPRYTMNLYLTKSTDAFKVMKDMLSNFLTIMYYLNGQLFPVQDSPSGPVYSFSKANVIDGSFAYENTGSKTRVNQVVVEWNNPENNFELEPLIVEDRRAIAESGVLISQKATAFGCTSEGQATRYGRWKLWTAANQQEIVTFATGINGSYITPGDIILVQDSDRNAVRFSGRISSTGTLDTDTIPLDSSITIDAANTYEISVIIQKPCAFLAQDSASISFDKSNCSAGSSTTSLLVPNITDLVVGMGVSGTNIPAGTTISSIDNSTTVTVSQLISTGFTFQDITFTRNYVKGDIVEKAYVDVGTTVFAEINTSDRASDAREAANSSSSLLLNWNEDFRVETAEIDKSATGTGAQSSITLSTPLTETPEREDIWVVVEKNADGNTIEGSGKEYRVLSSAQDDNNHYEISAVEHYDSKYDSIEESFTTYVSQAISRPVKSTDIVPPPQDLWVATLLTEHEDHENVRIYYTPAEGSFVDVTQPDGTVTQERESISYNGQSYVEITHTIPDPDNPSPTRVKVNTNGEINTKLFRNVPPGDYEVQVRTVGPLGTTSLPLRRKFTVDARLRNRIAGYFPEAAHIGGSSTRGVEIV